MRKRRNVTVIRRVLTPAGASHAATLKCRLCACCVAFKLHAQRYNSPSPRRSGLLSASCLHALSTILSSRGREGMEELTGSRFYILPSGAKQQSGDDSDVISQLLTKKMHPGWKNADNPPPSIPIAEHCGRSASPLRLSPPVASLSSWQQQRGCGCAGARAHTGGGGITCTSSWTGSSAVHWRTGGRHRSAKHTDLASGTRW